MKRILSERQKEEFEGFVYLILGIFLLLSLIFPEKFYLIGKLTNFLHFLFGYTSFLIPLGFFILSILRFNGKRVTRLYVKFIGFFILIFSISIIFGSGIIGDFSLKTFEKIIGLLGTYLFAVLLIILSIYLLNIEEVIKKILKKFYNLLFPPKIKIEKKEDKPKIEKIEYEIVEKVKKVDTKFTFPDISCLKGIKAEKTEKENLKEIGNKLVETLKDFGIKTEICEINTGPVITRYELKPAAGVRISKITSLSNDIALSLKTTQVRIIAPIPGKGTVGIEVPNTTWQTVHIKEILEIKNWNANKILPMALGKATDGTPIIADLTTLPHLLIAGTTGSGKSMCINAIIMSFLYTLSPDELKLILIDPKRVEFMVYEGLPHLFAPIITRTKKVPSKTEIDSAKDAPTVLEDLIKIMEKRYQKFSEIGVRDLVSFNKKSKEKEPYIVVIIDELAELMLVAAREVENSITRLAQLARGVGIHLIFATQRPSVDVITGIIKANLPSRIAFQVSSKVDSRTILDENGAENLLGRGDMLFFPSTSPKPIRLQGCFVDKDEIETVVKFIREQNEYIKPIYYYDYYKIFSTSLDEEDPLADIPEEDREKFKEALIFIKERKIVSTTLLQGVLHISGPRTASIVSAMEKKKLISPASGAKRREIYLDRIEEILKKIS